MGLAIFDVVYVYLVDVVNFIKTFFTRNTHKDLLRTLLGELGVTDHQILRFASWQEQSVALQAVVKRSHMTWFKFAQYLLRSKPTRPIVFKIAEYTEGEWYQYLPSCIACCLNRLSSLQFLFVTSSSEC